MTKFSDTFDAQAVPVHFDQMAETVGYGSGSDEFQAIVGDEDAVDAVKESGGRNWERMRLVTFKVSDVPSPAPDDIVTIGEVVYEVRRINSQSLSTVVLECVRREVIEAARSGYRGRFS